MCLYILTSVAVVDFPLGFFFLNLLSPINNTTRISINKPEKKIMLRLSRLMDSEDSKKCDSGVDMNMEHSQFPTLSNYTSPSPQSPQSLPSSTPASPVPSIFSAKTHTRFPSSVSSLASSPVTGNSTEGLGSAKAPLTEVKEDPLEREAGHSFTSDYFGELLVNVAPLTTIVTNKCQKAISRRFHHHASPTSNKSQISSALESHEYDLTDEIAQGSQSPKKRRSDDSSFRGISRISSRLSSLSMKRKQKSVSDSSLDQVNEIACSPADSVSSSWVNPAITSAPACHSPNPPSPARTLFEERISESGVQPIDISQANSIQEPEIIERHATTPLLPPLMMDNPVSGDESIVNSPLQSPSVADVTDSSNRNSAIENCQPLNWSSPPLSTRPSISSMSRPRAGTRTTSADAPPIVIADSDDEWSHKLGHANFTIHPEPYVPSVCDLNALRQHRVDWDLARCNYTKHLVRTGEHSGVTSKIYKLTEEKWKFVDNEWKRNHELVISSLKERDGEETLSLTKSNAHPCDMVKIPRLHDNAKFPELGDQDIVGPMVVGPVRVRTNSQPKSFRTRTFLKFLRGLFLSRSNSTGVAEQTRS